MLSFFKKAYFLNYLTAFIIIIICWLPAFFIPQDSISLEVLQYDSILKSGFNNVYLLNSFGLFVTLISALILNYLSTENGFTGKLMTMGIFFFSILSVSLSPFAIMNPFILINFFLFFFIRNLYRLPNVENPIPLVFNASLMLGLSSLYFFKIIFLVLVVWVALIIHRLNSWRNYIASIIGIIVPYLFVITWYFWSDQLNDFILKMEMMFIFRLNTDLSLGINDLIILVIIAGLIIIGVFKTITHLTEKNINLRRNLIISIYFLIIALIIVVIFGQGIKSLLITIIPASIILSNAFYDLRRYRFYNIFFSVLIVFIMINQFLKLFLD